MTTSASGKTVTVTGVAATTGATEAAASVGVASFDSAAFTVTNGFVELIGGGVGLSSVTVDAATAPGVNPVVPTAGGMMTIQAAVVAAHSVPIETRSRAVNEFSTEIQYAAAAAATDGTKSGVAHFDSAVFTVDASGFVTLASGGAGQTITGDSGGALAPTLSNWNILGSGSITTSGAVSTLTVALTGLTNHAVLVGAGTTTITKVGPVASTGSVLMSNGVGSDPGFSTATYPLTTTVSQLLYSSATNTVSGLATTNRAVLTTGTTGVPVMTALATDGQLIIGSTAGAPAAATLTGGTGVDIVNASNSVTINATGGGLTWENVTDATKAMVVNTGYFADHAAAVAFTLPATAALGSIIRVAGIQGSWSILQNAGQTVYFGTAATTTGVGGSLASSDDEDCVEIVCRVASTDWQVLSSVGNISVT
ncbi:MAG: hypothetical protein Q8O94_03575 [bacterium]|nr:hypothetical protein [bacterium]